MLSMFTVTGQVLKTFVQSGQVDKETGEVGKSSAKVQIMGEMPVQGGESRLDLITLTVENQKAYDDLKGKRVRVPLGFFAPQKGNIVYFIPKGATPEIVTAYAWECGGFVGGCDATTTKPQRDTFIYINTNKVGANSKRVKNEVPERGNPQ